MRTWLALTGFLLVVTVAATKGPEAPPVDVVVFFPPIEATNNRTFATSQPSSFGAHYASLCGSPFTGSMFARPGEWEQGKICSSSWLSLGSNYTEDDEKIWAPRVVINKNVYAPGASDYLTVPRSACVLEQRGYFDRRGLLFTCNKHFPLIMPRNRRDLSLERPISDPIPTSAALYELPPSHQLFSLVLPYNDYFGHAMTTGVSLLAQILPLLSANPNSSVLVPSRGPLSTILSVLDFPSSRIIMNQPNALYYSDRATMYLRKEPFNIITAHWMGRSVQGLRLALTSKLFQKLSLPPLPPLTSLQNTSSVVRRSSAKSGSAADKASLSLISSAPSPRGKYVIFLSRPPGERALSPPVEAALLSQLQASLQDTAYSLIVFGRDETTPVTAGPGAAANITARQPQKAPKLDPTSGQAFLSTAQYFLQAAAIIGVHGSAFGNIFLSPTDAVIIEINVPWIAKLQQDSPATPPATRDAIRSTCHNAGQPYFYTVFPLLPKGTPISHFYGDGAIKIDVGDVMAILHLHGVGVGT